MKIDYRKEVDSGFDRKRIVEANIVALLKEGIPVEVITESQEFNFRHLEMIRNLEVGYERKEEQLLDLFGGYSNDLNEQIVPDRYSGVSHPVGGELYPMEKEEEYEKFSKRNDYIKEIERLTKTEIKRLEHEKTKASDALVKYQAKFPVINRILSFVNELDELTAKTKDSNIDALTYVELCRKYGFSSDDLPKYNIIYNDYMVLVEQLNGITLEYEAALNNKFSNPHIIMMIEQKNELETELVQRNVKLVNAFIRRKYRNLLVETDDLFQVCYIAMWEAAKKFDPKAGKKFSSLAYAYMEGAVKRNFKELTGYRWENYWEKKKITTMIKTTSELLGHHVNILQLYKLGLISQKEFISLGYLGIIEEQNLSDAFRTIKQDYEDYEQNSQYAMYFGDDEVEDYQVEKIEATGDEWSTYKGELEVLKKPQKRQLIKLLFDIFNQNEALVLVLRYGLADDQSKTHEEIGRILNIDKKKIKMMESKLLRRLYKPENASKLKEIFDISEIRENQIKFR